MTRRSIDILRATLKVSVGTAVVQASAVAGQFLFAIWLTPVDFGYWAAASASAFVFFALINFGEVNGYLMSTGSDYPTVRRVTDRINVGLALGATALAGAYFAAGQQFVALLILVLAVDVPVVGRSNLLYAVCVKHRRHHDLIRAQLLAAVCRLALGVTVAWLTGSAIALAVSMLCYSLVLAVDLRRRERKFPPETGGRNRAGAAHGRSLVRGVQSVSQILPTQIDYLVVSFLSNPEILGIYFFAYQATVALSGLIAVPLGKTALAELARTPLESRQLTTAGLILMLGGGAGFVVGLASAVLWGVSPSLPTHWEPVVPVMILLLSSLPGRFMSPLTDSLQVSNGNWRRSIGYNLADSVGTAGVACVAILDDTLLLAGAITTWKVVFGCLRTWKAMRTFNQASKAMLVAPNLAYPLIYLPVMTWRQDLIPAAAVAALILGGVQLFLSTVLRGSSRRDRKERELSNNEQN